MYRSGQSTVELMFALTAVILSLALFLYVRPDVYGQIVNTIAEWVAARVDLP